MAKFTFRLETVLRVREQEEMERRKELMEEETLLREIQQRVIDLEGENRKIEDSLRGHQGQGGSAQELASHIAYLHALKGRMVEAQDGVMRQQNITERKRREVAEAQKNKKMIENLREKSYREWREEREELERKDLDEIAMLRHSRNRDKQ